jgi:uncharacterized protein (DUF1684 family)
MNSIKLLTVLFIIIIAWGCGTKDHEPKGSPEYIAEVVQWHQKRIERLKDENGWLTLVGLHWLKEGENTFGSDKSNSIVFPENAPKTIGAITLNDSTVFLEVNAGVNVTSDGNPVKQIALENDLTGEPTILDVGSLRWYIIKRDERNGIRLRDINAPLRNEFDGVERFAVNDEWSIEANFEAYNPPKIISVPNILGTVNEEASPGKVLFKVNGVTHQLDAINAGNKLWFIFADETSDEETYGAGRYLYADKPDSNGNMIIDFNYAYNPPCVFTKFATCPFPPKQNLLKLKITAGEKMWDKH